MNGKNEFYPEVEKTLILAGYDYSDGDRDIKGKTRQHQRKPDYIASKNGEIIIGEIKSPNEPPTSGSWRQKQPNDSHEFAEVRQEVHEKEKAGKVSPEVGGHEIIIKGQIPDYVSNLGITYDLPSGISSATLKGGYSVPSEQSRNVEMALRNCGKSNIQIIDFGGNGVTFVFEL